MMVRIYNATGARSYKNSCIESLKRLIYDINKNFGQMDFENANAQEEMEQIVLEMIDIVNKEISRIEGLTFYSMNIGGFQSVQKRFKN